MGVPAMGVSSTTSEIYMQVHEQTAIYMILHSYDTPLIVSTWKTFSITAAIFIKTLSLLWRNKVMEN